MQRFIVATLSAAIVGALATAPTLAGLPAQNANWTNSPTQGPSPNPSHTVANTDGGECLAAGPTPVGVSVAGPPPADLIVNVHLSSADGGTDYAQTSFQPDAEGDWSGTFAIPAGLAPGLYKVEAECAFEQQPARAGAVALGGIPVLFSYADRSYTVVAESDPGDPVEAEVTFTGEAPPAAGGRAGSVYRPTPAPLGPWTGEGRSGYRPRDRDLTGRIS